MKRARRFLPRLLGAAGLTAALVAVITAFSSTGFSQTAANSEYAPKNESPPTISGTAVVGNTLTATQGSWTSSTAIKFAYQWLHCDKNGNGCSFIGGATTNKYQLKAADANNSVKVRVTATNSSGSASADSTYRVVSPASTPPPATTTTPAPSPSAKVVAATNVKLPDRLTVDQVKFSPQFLTSRAPFVGRFHVRNNEGQAVSGALVYVIGLPYSWARSGLEVPTDANGWATLTIRPTRNMPMGRGHALVMFVRARAPGQPLLAGVSTRRLVQVTTR
jgi:hypothetical protein